MVLFVIGLVLFIGAFVALILAVDGPGWVVALGFTIMVLGIILMIMSAIQIDEDEKNACKDIGGEYIVIKREYSISLKQVVDVYGCIK